MKPIDFQGIASLGLPLVDHMKGYLQEKEAQLAASLTSAIHPLPHEGFPPILPPSGVGSMHLAAAVDVLAKNVHRIESSDPIPVSANDWELAVRHINTALWEYLEILEGCVTELFQQIGQIGFEQWDPDLIRTVEQIQQTLDQRMELLGVQIKRLESLLWEYRWTCEGKKVWWQKILSSWKSLLDRSLNSYLNKSRKYLNSRFKWFSQRFTEYQKLKLKIERSLRKFKSYLIFKSLEQEEQVSFKKIYELLKLWELNRKEKSLPTREPIRALRSAYSMKKVLQLFKTYSHFLKEALFERSRKFKQDPASLYADFTSRGAVAERIKGLKAEAHTLGATIAKYREFYLRTHPNPYIRTRWGFAEWVVGPEPTQTKELLSAVYEVEELDRLFDKLAESLQKGPSAFDSTVLNNQYRDAQRILHDMGQPLTSRSMMHDRAMRLLAQVEEMNELGSFNPEVCDRVGLVFSRALRADWQFHVLFDIPLFHQLFQIHQGILGVFEDRRHLQRMNAFREILSRLKRWVESRDTHRHVHEIESDMNDIKSALQDFLGSVQKSMGEEQWNASQIKGYIEAISQQLLEYRYTFGQFFYLLHQHEPEGKLIRNQFLFVDHYFESVENQLHQARNIPK